MNLTTQKQRCLEIIEILPAEQLQSVAAFLENIHNQLIEEAEDDAFCMKLYEESLGFDDDEAEDIEVFVAKLGIASNP
ncbi:MAG: hypothetical protein FWG63_02400 [Defluviitaleaceae bacterium]|nr:hypothetical protein [Defluviitaleaceae bacterium]